MVTGQGTARARSQTLLALIVLVVLAGPALSACGGNGSTEATSSSPSATPTAGVSGPGQQDKLVWKFATGAAVRSSPAVAGGVVYLGSDDGHLYAVDVTTGQQRWAFRTGGAIRSALAVANGTVYCRSVDGYLHAVDIPSGQERWKFLTGPPADSSPAVADGTVYVAGDVAGSRTLYALDSRSGRERWRIKTGGGPYVTSPAASGGVVYFGFDAFDAKTGEKKWTFEVYGMPRATPVVSHGLVYFRAEGWTNGMCAVDAHSGRGKWSFYAGWSSAAVSGGVVYCNGQGLSAMSRSNRDVFRLHALDARNGKEIWASDGSDEGSVAVSGGLVCFTDEKMLYAMDVHTGQAEWQFETGGSISSSPAISNGVVYVGSDDGYLYAVKE